MVASSKRFTSPSRYEFSLAIYVTFDGGESWKEIDSLDLLPGWSGTSDPALAWDDKGNAYLVALPYALPGPRLIGIAVYKSLDGGLTWSSPILIHENNRDDKQWAAADTNPDSPYYGNIYAAWDIGGVGTAKLAFARSTDHGMTWKGINNRSAGTELSIGVNDSGSPELSVASGGTIYIVWLGGHDIKFVKSNDGGESFSTPIIAAQGVTPLESPLLPETNGRVHFPGATFRVGTFATGCTDLNNVIFAWADYREGVSRIYYRLSTDSGNTWKGHASGQRLLLDPLASASNQQDFHPQLICTPGGEVGCVFYEFGYKGSARPSKQLIDVIFAASTDNGETFSERITVTDYPWDPAVGAPFSGGDPKVTFIGEYFGFDASHLGFFPLWTDTRTGMQEIFMSRINEV
jgi:hypothetical protein